MKTSECCGVADEFRLKNKAGCYAVNALQLEYRLDLEMPYGVMELERSNLKLIDDRVI